jgi:hypothetical protein
MASGFRMADPREYRRGVILGLTLAEVLILLVFLLLLSSSALLAHRDDEIRLAEVKLARYETALVPFTRDAKANGADLDTNALISRLERVSDYERMARELEATNSALTAARTAAVKSEHELGEMRKRMDTITIEQKTLTAKAADDDAMAALLERASANGDTPAEKLRHVLDQAARQASVDGNLTGQNAQMRVELSRLKGNGGSGLPHCWTTVDGHPIYMLRIELRDDGVIAHELSPRPKPDDHAWGMLEAVPREELMPVARLLSGSAPLQAAAASERCRYAVLVSDGTGKTNKLGYKSLMGRLWSAFVLREGSG